MEWISRGLTDYIIRCGVINPDDREVYQYGFVTALELLTSFLASMVIAAMLHMTFGGILFFLVFIPLRSYAGGLHLKHFYSCFLLSCMTFAGVLLCAKYVRIPDYIALSAAMACLLGIRLMHPVNHENRPVDIKEEQHFTGRLRLFLILDAGGILFLFYVLKNEFAVRVMGYTLLMIVLTMLPGKFKKVKNDIP